VVCWLLEMFVVNDGRALNDYPGFCQHHEINAEASAKERLSWYVHDFTSRPNPRGANVRQMRMGRQRTHFAVSHKEQTCLHQAHARSAPLRFDEREGSDGTRGV